VNDDEHIQQAAEIAVGAPVSLLSQTFMMESVGSVLWKGEVSEFVTQDHRRVYAWSVERPGEETQYIVQIHQPPIDSALAAFRAWMKKSA